MPECLHSNISKQIPGVRSVPRTLSAAEVGFVALLVGRSIADVERELIRETLARFHGSRTRAAKVLAISVRTLSNKINAYKARGVDMPEAKRTGRLLEKLPTIPPRHPRILAVFAVSNCETD